MDFLIEPVDAGLIDYRALRDGSVTLEDILLLNVYLDNKRYNAALLARLKEEEYGRSD